VWQHGRHTERRWSHSNISPTHTLYPASRYGSALVELNSTQTPLLVRWCVRKGPVRRSVHSLSDRGELMSSKRAVKPQHLCSENRKSRNALRSAPPSPIPDQLFRAHPCKSAQNAFSCQFLPHTRQERLFPSQHMHRKAQCIYALIYNIVVVGQSRT
jgi:hypothetical protein